MYRTPQGKMLDSILDAPAGIRLGMIDNTVINHLTGTVEYVKYFEVTPTTQIRFHDGKWQQYVIDCSIEFWPGVRFGWVDHKPRRKADEERSKANEEKTPYQIRVKSFFKGSKTDTP